ncbi:unnamed protein product [Rotaria magnacalcarata]|uniref:Uncharacterized protein n=2 Tax=Rotaria magnacalcarata TaxID=392030 RepID=A0A816C6H5_9BILA|nr:unnamed protein product [Rotaria magnacalcarata]CAF1618997.1 unnamed protein product [Rotaria magnacalcarata]CAF2248232.1 unnamed protein product [Rotaria magnacalcarata]CAF3891230.1 unnamed protein product [Rotaria magnacalcarata]CAF3996088.1 unnamed protein product [Rotaria magnacalcarata]
MGGSSSKPKNAIVQINQQYVNTCEEFWRKSSVTWNHKTIKSCKTLASVSEAKSYITATADNWHINDKPGGNEFIRTLLLNAELSGNASSEYIDAEFKIGGKDGTATYIYVIVSNQNGSITVAFSYHHLTESLSNNSTYTSYAADITIDWLKWKACENLQAILSTDLAPQIRWK